MTSNRVFKSEVIYAVLIVIRDLGFCQMRGEIKPLCVCVRACEWLEERIIKITVSAPG